MKLSTIDSDQPHYEVTSSSHHGRKGRKGRGGRTVSCVNCKKRKMKCSRSSPCSGCTMRGEHCEWVGAKPTRTVEEATLEQAQTTILQQREAIDLLTEENDKLRTQVQAMLQSAAQSPSPPEPSLSTSIHSERDITVPSHSGPSPDAHGEDVDYTTACFILDRLEQATSAAPPPRDVCWTPNASRYGTLESPSLPHSPYPNPYHPNPTPSFSSYPQRTYQPGPYLSPVSDGMSLPDVDAFATGGGAAPYYQNSPQSYQPAAFHGSPGFRTSYAGYGSATDYVGPQAGTNWQARGGGQHFV